MKQLRAYRDSDAETILSWSKDETSYYLWCAGVLGPWPASKDQMTFLHAMHAYVWEENDMPIGMFTLRWPEENRRTMRFGFVIVDPARRREGIASVMLEEGLRLVFDHFHAETAELAVFEQNAPAIACYKAAGFREVPDRCETIPIGGKVWTCRVMEATREDRNSK